MSGENVKDESLGSRRGLHVTFNQSEDFYLLSLLELGYDSSWTVHMGKDSVLEFSTRFPSKPVLFDGGIPGRNEG
jgi:hypothetical protein